MFGAIIGDVIGSVYERDNVKTKDFPLFRDDCFFTDDTVMTIATADALMSGGQPEHFVLAYQKWGRRYPQAGYGMRFRRWLREDDPEPYNSWGNGSAMRVSPCAWRMDCGFYERTGIWPANGMLLAQRSAEVTHNHPEGIKGALAVTEAIFLCRYYSEGYGDSAGNAINEKTTLEQYKKEIKQSIVKQYGYDLSRTLDEIRPDNRFNESCAETVPPAIIAFLESTSFEDAIRNAISIGGDSDTIAAITGSIAEAAYGIPDWILKQAWAYLDEPIRDICRRWQVFLQRDDLIALPE